MSPKSMTRQQEVQVDIHQQLASGQLENQPREFEKIYSKYWNRQYLSHIKPHHHLILDVGCGMGDLTRELAQNAALTVGMDISVAMLNNAKRMSEFNKNIIWTGCVGEQMPFADGMFDVVCFRGALHHMSDEKAALRESYRILKPGGVMMLSEPNADSIILSGPRKIVTKKMERFGGDHKAFLSKEWIKTIESMGFSIIHTKYFSYLSQPLCSMNDILPLLDILPFSNNIANFLVAFDEICSQIPFLKQQSFDLFIAAVKQSNP